MRVQYEVSSDHPDEHRAQIRMQVTDFDQASIALVLPSWVPGSYWIQNQARDIRRLTASEGLGGAPLRVTRIDKARWQIPTEGVPAVDVRYEVYGNEMRTEAVDVTSEHLFLNGGLCFPYVDGHKETPSEVVVHIPPSWRIFTELKEVGKNPARYRAENYDELVDSPIDCGTPDELTTHPNGIPHRMVLCGHGGNYETHRLEEDVRKFVEATIRLFGDSPLSHYTFFVHLNDVSDGGLEHHNSNSCVVPRTTFKPESSYQRFLALLCHEYFHLYNVKRIRPKVLVEFDYTRENYTHLLWLMEGTTDYYGHLLLRRGNLVDPKRYLEKVAERVHRYLNAPGRTSMNLEEASFLSWIEHYHPNEESRNRSVSYYHKGDLVSACLDLEIRNQTENRRSLDDVLRYLWNQYGKTGRGLEEGEVPALAATVTGLDLEGFFRRYVTGTEEIDFERSFRLAGLKFQPKETKVEPGDDTEPGYLGIEFAQHEDRIKVNVVLDGGPARRAGISPGDEIVALNGSRVPAPDFEKALKRHPAGSSVDVALFRRGWLMTVPVVTGRPPPEKYLLTPVENPSPLEKAIYESWLGATWEPPKKPDVAKP